MHVVNDLREPVAALVSATASWRGGHRQWGFRGTIDGDACELVGTLEFAAPERPGELLLGIALTGRTDSGTAISATRRAGRACRLSGARTCAVVGRGAERARIAPCHARS